MIKLKSQPSAINDGNELKSGLNPHQALFDSIPQSGFKCDLMFWVIKYRVREEREFLKKIPYVYQFNITKNKKHVATWTLDLKSNNCECDVYNSAPPFGTKTDCDLTVNDDDLLKIMVGKLNPHRAFMLSTLKVRGNIMLLQKLHSVWYELRKKGRAKEMELVQHVIVDAQLVPGLRSEAMAIEMIQRIVKFPSLSGQINGLVRFDILKKTKLVAQYWIGLFPSKRPEVHREIIDSNQAVAGGILDRKQPTNQTSNRIARQESDLVYIVEDDDFVLILFGVLNINQAIETGRLRVEGKPEVAERAKLLLERPAIMYKL